MSHMYVLLFFSEGEQVEIVYGSNVVNGGTRVNATVIRLRRIYSSQKWNAILYIWTWCNYVCDFCWGLFLSFKARLQLGLA